MKRATVVVLTVCLGGCFERGMPDLNDDEGTTAMEPGTDGVGDDASMSGGSPTSPSQGPTGDPTGQDPATGSSGDESSSDDGEPVDPGDYQFQDAPPEEYDQVDRMGMPAVNTAVISSKNEYNTSSPEDDAASTFVAEIVENLTGLHAALDDDLMAAELVPCAVDDCVAQAAPLVVPDTITITLGDPAGFPNGRLPEDPVMDVTLAVVLLDLGVEGQDALSLVGLNPTENDVAFLDSFPYFAPPHE